jgi:hypothetical protein
MKRGKNTCRILKEIRKQIAEENDIKLVIEECTYQGDCLGTCPKCEAEVRYLERELEKRQRMGKAAVVAGLSVGLLGTSQVTLAQQPDTIPPQNNDTVTILEGYVVPVITQPEPKLMGKMPGSYHIHFEPMDIEAHPELMDLFSYPDMKNLSIVGFDLDYPFEALGDTTVCDPFNNTNKFYAPCYLYGESSMLEFISQNLGENADGRAYGDMEVAFTVEPNGRLSHIDILKGINTQLDAQVAALFKFMEWKPAVWELKSSEKIPFACQCAQKLHFPMITH